MNRDGKLADDLQASRIDGWIVIAREIETMYRPSKGNFRGKATLSAIYYTQSASVTRIGGYAGGKYYLRLQNNTRNKPS